MGDRLFKKTKIVATIGPASDKEEIFRKLYEEGMNVMRMNFSHGEYSSHLQKLQLARKLEDEGIYIGTMLDTKGPEIRCQEIEGGKVQIPKGQIIRISMTPVVGTAEKFSVTYTKLYDDVSIGNHIKIDDGKLNLEVIEKDEKNREIVCKALNAHFISSKKGVNCPDAKLNSLEFISERDRQDLIWGCEHEVDFVSASFVRNPQDVRDIRKLLTEHGHPEIKIISKIENYEAINCLEAIVDESDGIMVARGDLGIEIPEEQVPIIQADLIRMCRNKGKPVITATQMLDSMVSSPIPTRAEVGDVATAINESTDCVMLSGESASGLYPVESVMMQAKIAHAMEEHLDYELMAREAYETSLKDRNDAIANAICNTAKLIGAKLIVSFTDSGRSSRRISKARPCCPILSISNKLTTVRQNSIYWGINSVLLKSKRMPEFIEDMEVVALVHAKRLGAKPGDIVLISGGTPTGSGHTNFMRIIQVPQDRDLL